MIINTGGASGADYWFKAIGEECGFEIVCHSFKGHNRVGNWNNKSVIEYPDHELFNSKQNLKKVRAFFKQKYPQKPYIEKLLLRNLKIIDSSDMIVGVGKMDSWLLPGGTSTGIMYSLFTYPEKPVIYFDQLDCVWKKLLPDLSVVEHNEEIKAKIIAGIGTRTLNFKGKQAIYKFLHGLKP